MNSLRFVPDRVRIPIGLRDALTVDCLRPDTAGPQRPIAPPPLDPPRPPAPEPPAPAVIPPAHPVLIAVVEAVPAGGEEFVSAAAAAWAAAGRRVAMVSLDKQNRLAARFGRSPAPAWLWTQAAPELFQPASDKSDLLIVPGPSAEAEVSADAADRVVSSLLSHAEVCLVDLGCRWEPRLFRSVLFHASHIIVLTRSGQWSGAEMRLEQAELSGWTDMRKLRLVVVGASLPPPGMLGSAVAALLPEPGGQEAQAFVMREVGRSQR